jgi:hypothetical protein
MKHDVALKNAATRRIKYCMASQSFISTLSAIIIQEDQGRFTTS